MLSLSNSPTDSHYDNSLNINGHNYLHSYLDKPLEKCFAAADGAADGQRT